MACWGVATSMTKGLEATYTANETSRKWTAAERFFASAHFEKCSDSVSLSCLVGASFGQSTELRCRGKVL
eukprot:14825569-Alexandrium_andersonii.AAC.1